MTKVTPGVQLRLEVLRALMAERGWNWSRLAEHTGMPLSSVVRIRDGEMGLTGLTISQLLRPFPRVKEGDLFDFGRDQDQDRDRVDVVDVADEADDEAGAA